ncbi:GNAT family N-acetyltransferase [Alteromonas antoniana]|uniref:GNAT family N-acetyltransferase n=1 Tax=Alteromonas antoniana TaxID=2803813 RepID=UPI001C47F1A4|nr:GNAT family N-acetyltransferase [Alteromonas antoniana]
MNGIKITSNHSDLDLNVIHAFISESYWAKNIPIVAVEKAISNSLVFGAYNTSGEQIRFARVITNKATFAYLGDVFVLDEFRGLGISKLLMKSVCEHPDLQGLRRFMLATSDAHGLYSQFGFKPLENTETFMQIWQPGIYD